MLRWSRVLDGDKVLNAEAREKLFKRHVKEPAGSDSYYGYGWSITTSAWGTKLIEHNGGNGVFYCDLLRFPDDDMVVILSTNDSTVRGARISHAVAQLAHGDDVPVPKPEPATAKPLGSSGRDAVIRAWFEAFNAPGLEPMRAFRAQHQVPRPGMTDAERDERLARMREDLGTLSPEGIVDDSGGKTVVRAKGSTGAKVTFTFNFNAEGKIEGIGAEIGN
jgi:hypothetical protein